MHRHQCAHAALLGLALATLTACGPESPTSTDPSTTADTGARGSSATPSASSADATAAAPVAHPIRGDDIRFLDLTPSLQQAQNAQSTFAFTAELSGETATGKARCQGAVAWQVSAPESEQINVDGKEYRRQGDRDFRVQDDRDATVDGDNPCNPTELVRTRDRAGLVLSVQTRAATADGRTGLIHLRGTADRSGTTYDFWLEDSRRPVRVQIHADGRTQSIAYRDYGKPVTITAPRNVRSSTAPPAPCRDRQSPGCAAPSRDTGAV